ncbi:hypothetical protein GOV12_03975 [Candidatus Pacearchaeota archaeon]|nr:hypothetical protein [Candidatus Pacearchaeota archaeon]
MGDKKKNINNSYYWKIFLISFLIVFVIIAGIKIYVEMNSKPCSIGKRENCNTFCQQDSDCKFDCGCGPLNIKEKCDILGSIYDCLNIDVKCEENKCVSIPTIGSIDFDLINNEDEALEFAKSDLDFINASELYKKNFNRKINYNTYYNEEGFWDVSVWPDGVLDAWYEIKFYPNGTIISKGYGKGA